MIPFAPNHDPATCAMCLHLPTFLRERGAEVLARAEQYGEEIQLAELDEYVPDAPELTRAAELGHTPVWDPPAVSGSVKRWTCPCGSAVLVTAHTSYGSALTRSCPLRSTEVAS